MAQIQAGQAQVTREVIRYRLEPLDIVLPILGACWVLLALGLSGQLAFLGISSPLPWAAVLPAVVSRLPAEWISSQWLSLVGLLVIAEICAGALFCLRMWLDWPLPFARR
jgi:hypothetical protein